MNNCELRYFICIYKYDAICTCLQFFDMVALFNFLKPNETSLCYGTETSARWLPQLVSLIDAFLARWISHHSVYYSQYTWCIFFFFQLKCIHLFTHSHILWIFFELMHPQISVQTPNINPFSVSLSLNNLMLRAFHPC